MNSRALFGLSLFLVTLALAGCGYPYCVLGIGQCSKYAGNNNGTNTGSGGTLGITVNPYSIISNQTTTISVGGGNPAYTLVACVTPTNCSNSTSNGTFSNPGYYLSNTTSATYQPLSGPPTGVTPLTDNNGKQYYNMTIQVSDSQSHTAVAQLQVYLP